ncbi:YccT family protein [Enterovibrio norvegicus]|uniref:YccT family protein n=1 Tax=Enterovibrio norvegicus TaxID=188144 RepID=UPI00352D6C72
MKLVAIGLVVVSSVVGAAELTTKNGLEFLVVNGKSATNVAKGGDKKLDLDPGKYQIVARFDEEVKRGSKSTIFTSKPYVFEIEMSNQDLVLVIPKLKFESQAAAFFKKPEWEIENKSSGAVQSISGVRLTGVGFGSFNNMEKAVAQYNSDNGIIFESGEAKNLEEMLVNVDEKGNVNIKGDTLTQLKLWYTKASTEEKKAFKRWMIEQDF